MKHSSQHLGKLHDICHIICRNRSLNLCHKIAKDTPSNFKGIGFFPIS